ncbi:rod shape-determining protein MreD [Persephonella hydrogeniphila]|uniref:Rod shape-determining protein MreD n=1 Tax=Persephonella hydrogeniphila TaxID=198703 RepID=A0A285NCW4_9AQUI|nr:rod shape-determining protein MreD [Persephonella hydrogeniphila]SNZ07138.1 rod shape-determining protein MreD [Persephonella hydrogeniphila]
MRLYFFAFSLFLLQISIITRFFSFEGIIPDFLTIFVIIYSLKNSLKESIKMAVFVGILQDLLSPSGLIFNTLTKLIVVGITFSMKDRFYYSNLVVKGVLIVVITFIDIGIKSSLIFFKTGIFEISYYHLVYLVLNFVIFYLVTFLDEVK